MIRASWVGDYNEPSTFLSLLTSSNTGNISRFSNPAYDKVVNQATLENTEKARNADYNEAEKILAEKAPIAPIYQYTNGRLIKPWLKGYPIENPEDVAVYADNVYCEALSCLESPDALLHVRAFLRMLYHVPSNRNRRRDAARGGDIKRHST